MSTGSHEVQEVPTSYKTPSMLLIISILNLSITLYRMVDCCLRTALGRELNECLVN